MGKDTTKSKGGQAQGGPSGTQPAAQPGIDDLRFFELCYGEYRQEMQQADVLYQRFGILVTALPIIAAVAYKLGRPELVPKWFTRVDVFLYCTLASCAYGALAASLALLAGALVPKQYTALECMEEWRKYRDGYWQHLTGGQQTATEEAEAVVARQTLREMIPLLADAQTRCARVNEKRRKRFRWAVILACIAVSLIGAQAFFHMLLFLQGV